MTVATRTRDNAGRFAAGSANGNGRPRSRVDIALAHDEGGPSEEIIGSGGTPILGGMLGEDEWNPRLTGKTGLEQMEKMAVSDPDVAAGLAAITLPIVSADWFVVPASDTPRDKQIAEFVEANLFNMGDPFSSFAHWMDESIDGTLTFGHYPHEKLWKSEGGKWLLDNLSARPPRTIDEILIDDTGHFTGVKQSVQGTATFAQVEIPASKLMWAVRKMRGNNLRGRAATRAAYKPWFIKKELEVIASIAVERRAMGVDVAELEGDEKGMVTTPRRKTAEKALMGLASREKQFLALPPWMKYRLEGLRGSVIDPVPMIKLFSIEILRAMLAEFIALGSDGSGSLAMSRDKSSFFTMSINGEAEVFKSAVNWQVIPQLVRFNFGADIPDAELPFLDHGPLDTRNFGELAKAVSTLTTAGVLTSDRETENAIRAVGSLPKLVEQQQAMARAGVRMRRAHPSTCTGHVHAKSHRPLRPIEKVCDFQGMNDEMDRAIERIVAIVSKAQEKQIKSMVARTERAFERGDLDDLNDLTVPGEDEVAADIEKELKALAKEGARNVRSENRKQGLADKLQVGPPDPEKADELAKFLRFRSKAMASIMSAKLLSSYKNTVAPMARTGTFSGALLAQNLGELANKEITKAAGLSVSEALNLGRKAEFADNQEIYASFVYTTQGDESVCSPCLTAESEGEEIEPGSEEFDRLYPPFSDCEGGDRCRCQMIGVLKTEAVPGA